MWYKYICIFGEMASMWTNGRQPEVLIEWISNRTLREQRKVRCFLLC